MCRYSRYFGILWCLWIPIPGVGQILPDSLFEREDRFISLSLIYDHLAVDTEGNILLTSELNRQLTKLYADTNHDSALTIGGRSVREGGLLAPVEVLTATRQRVYILDEGNQSVLLFSKDLRLIQRFDFQQEETEGDVEAVPPFLVDMAAGPGDELFVLDQLGAMVRVYGTQPGQQIQFGGQTYGAGSLYAPVSVDVNAQNLVYVADTSLKAIQVYDSYGRYRNRIELFPQHPWEKAKLYGESYLCWYPQGLGVYLLGQGRQKWFSLKKKQPLLDVAVDQDFFYLLYPEGIYLFRIKS